MFGNKSFKFSGKEVSVLSLIFCVSLLVAFWLGYRTGHTVGFDYAQSANLSNIAKYPINDFAAPELDSDSVEEIYARLSDDAVTQAGTEVVNEVPALAPIAEENALIGKKEQVAEVPATNVAPANQAKEKTIIANLDALPQEPESVAALPVVLTDNNSKKEVEKIKETIAEPKPAVEVAPEKIKVTEPKTEDMKKEVADDIIEAKVIKPAPVAEPIKKTKIKAGWYAQVFAPQDKAIADKLASTLKQSGFPVIIEPTAGHYRVLVGPESNKQQGQVLLQQLGREKYLPGSPFLKQVK